MDSIIRLNSRINEIKYLFSRHLSRIFCCNHTCYCVTMVYVTPASRYITSTSRYHSRYQSRSSMYIRGLIPRNFAELAEAVPIWCFPSSFQQTWRESPGFTALDWSRRGHVRNGQYQGTAHHRGIHFITQRVFHANQISMCLDPHLN